MHAEHHRYEEFIQKMAKLYEYKDLYSRAPECEVFY